MYRAFTLHNIKWESSVEVSTHQKFNNIAAIQLQNFVENGVLDATKLAENWFPEIKADVFISHAHADEPNALACAGWLESSFGLTSFIDSCVWGHAEKLLKIIDNDLCRNDDKETYSYELRNRSTSHVHMMLAASLSNMIDRCECIFFLGTHNSITSEEAVQRTKSPWIMYELRTIHTTRRVKPARVELVIENFSEGLSKSAKAAWEASYLVSLESLPKLSADQLNDWRSQCDSLGLSGNKTLDYIYDKYPLEPDRLQ